MSKLSGKNVWILVLAAVILAAALSKGQSGEDISLSAAFFTVLGDILALLALQPGLTQREEAMCP